MKTGKYDDDGRVIRSQHSIFGPAKRVAGQPGNAPSWQESLLRSWNKFELRDHLRRQHGKAYYDEEHRTIPQVGTPQRLDTSGNLQGFAPLASAA